MEFNNNGTVINLRDKLLQVDRKKTQSDKSVQENSSGQQSSEKKFISDIIGIRNENKLAASSSNTIMSKDEALDMVEELKRQFNRDASVALDAHKKADANAVMQFYPFE